MTTTPGTPEREALAAAFDRLHDAGFQRQEDWFVKNAGEEFMEQIHVDTIARLAAPPAAGGQALTDEDCDKLAAQAMDRLAASMPQPTHALDLTPNVQEHHSLRRALVRAGVAALAATPPAAPAAELTEAIACDWDNDAAIEALAEEVKRLADEYASAYARSIGSVNRTPRRVLRRKLRAAIDALAASPAAGGQALSQARIDELIYASREADEGPTQLARRIEAAVLAATPPAAPAQAMPQGAQERLHTFLNAAAGEGFVLDGIDAADLYVELFPERYKDAILRAALASQEGAAS